MVIDREAKNELFDGFAVVGKAVSSGRRVELLDILANGERSVDALASHVGLSVANTSQHLQVLRRAGLVAARRDGTSVVYRLAGSEVFDFLRSIRALAASRVPGVERLVEAYLGPHDPEPPLPRAELAERLRRGGAPMILDVRPRDEYLAGHLPEAVSLPLDELAAGIHALPRDREIVAYCRGAYCAYAYQAVALLRQHGFAARRLEDGLPEWVSDDGPVLEGP